jgi:hypothetical protein
MAKKRRSVSPPPPTHPSNDATTHAEARRLGECASRERNWQRWGPYLSERQWGTVREDYSPDGEAWTYFPHDHARSRAYRWGEDGLLGIADRECRLCFALALWNGRDPILKERLFGLTGPQGNHGEDVKELYYYLDSSPTHSYMKALYKYPQAEFPYERLVAENAARGYDAPEFEIGDTGVFDDERYFDVFVEYAKAAPDDIPIRITIANRGPEAATLHVLPTLWFRNTWSAGEAPAPDTLPVSPVTGTVPRGSAGTTKAEAHAKEGCTARPRLAREADGHVVADHPTLGRFHWRVDASPDGSSPMLLFTHNETNAPRLFGTPPETADGAAAHYKDAFHDCVIGGRADAVAPDGQGTKAAAHYVLDIAAGASVTLRLRLSSDDAPKKGGVAQAAVFGPDFDGIFEQRIAETDAFYATRIPSGIREQDRASDLAPSPSQSSPDSLNSALPATAVTRQAYAGLLWSKQFYHYIVEDWLHGDPGDPAPPPERLEGRNRHWTTLYSRDVISMPDKWEYPWFAAWDLAFHMLPFATVDPQFAKDQLVLFLREWYMRTDGQLPAYEWNFSDVNPPMQAWACWRVYKIASRRGERDRVFLSRVFQKLIINFTWWINRKDPRGRNLFTGGFLGLDNIGVFDRSSPLPGGWTLEQADATAWMAFYCGTMLSMALELAQTNPATEDMASKFFEHFIAIADAMNTLGGAGLWDEEDGFYYDQVVVDGHAVPMKIRSMVGLVPLLAVEPLDLCFIEHLPGFMKRMNWFLENRQDLAADISYLEKDCGDGGKHVHRLLAIPSRERLARVLRTMLDEAEFFSPYGIRSLSRVHAEHPFVFDIEGQHHEVRYEPGESQSGLFGGNSNWRGPVWLPFNYLLIEALEKYHHFYGDTFRIECPTGSGREMNLKEVAAEIATRVSRLFLPDQDGNRPCHGGKAAPDSHGISERYATHPAWRDLVLFHEYFHAETGQGLGASHQTGWTALVIRCLEKAAAAGVGQPDE